MCITLSVENLRNIEARMKAEGAPPGAIEEVQNLKRKVEREGSYHSWLPNDAANNAYDSMRRGDPLPEPAATEAVEARHSRVKKATAAIGKHLYRIKGKFAKKPEGEVDA